jgi:hypothetical protein
MALWRFKNEPSAETRARFAAIFGKLTLRIGPTTWESELDGSTTRSTYAVVARDSRSVVVAVTSEDGVERTVSQYFFEEGYMYVVTGYNIEFFRRVEA